jgi:hypothetical protein
MGLNLGLRYEKPATNPLSYGTAIEYYYGDYDILMYRGNYGREM